MSESEKDYDATARQILLEQYKLYVEMADRISSRRQSANSFFLSVNTAIIALISYINFVDKNASGFYWLISIAGMIICFMWYRLVRSYKDLNTAKFKVIHEMEAKLPVAPYDLEWAKVGEGKNPNLYLPFTHIEIYIPWVFLIIHGFVFLNSLHIFNIMIKMWSE